MKGIAASGGIAIGKAYILEKQEIVVVQKAVSDITVEIERFKAAVEYTKVSLKAIYEETLAQYGKEKAEIFGAHLMILQDPVMLMEVQNMIKKDSVNAEWALQKTLDKFSAILEASGDPYMSERAADIKDVGSQIVKRLMNIEDIDISGLKDVVIIAKDITPSETSQIHKDRILGFITEIGGSTSHAAIMARTKEIPAVVGVKDIVSSVKNGDLVVFDGSEGVIYINPEEAVVREYTRRKEEYEQTLKKLRELIGAETVTVDGHKLELAANIGTPADLEAVLSNDAEGVGLFRTEFLFMDRNSAPTEEEQFNSYKAVASGMKGKPVIIRTLDIGGDKQIDYLNLPKEENSFLGYRAIRLCLDRTDIFKTQLRAILRASAHGNIKIMFPMISSLEEVLSAKNILNEVKADLKAQGINFDEAIKIGIMIEVPAAAIISDLLAKEVDFFSIGTNDLIQYTTAVDRMNEKIAHLYNPNNPAILRLVKLVINNAHREGKWVGMCGELAGDPRFIPALVGMGIDELSMSPSSVLKARDIIRNLSYKEAQKLAENI